MVLITLKKAEESLFLFEAPATSPLSELVPQLAKLQNYRLRLRRLIDAAEDLIEYGPLKPDDQHGYDEDQLEALSKEKPATPPLKQEVERDGRKVLLNPDPTGRRTGEAPTEDMAEIIQKTLTNAKACLSQDLVKSNKCLTFPDLDEAFSNIRGAVAIVWPMGLPEWEPVREILEDKEDLTGTAASKEVIDIDTASLWWAGKELQREKKLVDYVGKNDKTKIIVKIQKKGQGPPLREAPLSEQQQKDMMAYYYRKQEEHKKLAENDEDDYVNSAWANTKALKSAFSGVGNVSWRPT
ncbi:uncharacterized protein EV422DRAFT_605904 [Fimicolochytrium jonesii]|uniref:uncharacterized protein n=1 Tax=Fimicolochytrium jonesii TaxID=1396493 RepID=UPI0022FE0ADB|nr:uncharacterized protein EV422DRAFT_605904 [Fimicolochytrium jonesii]KAI8825209.1 hypothetical protein EV422DRAFT_605904 [Fimicolochytrium jonesii]